MSMSLAALEILEKAEFPPAQARAIARIFETEAAHRQEQLATKVDLESMKAEFKAEFARYATKADLAELKANLKHEIASAKVEGIRFTFLAVIGQATLLASLMYFMLQNLR